METMRVELVEDKKKKVNWWQAVPTIITAFVAVIGIVVSCLTYLSQRASANEDRAAQRMADRNNRFTYAIEHLKDESLAIRMGALYELKKLGLEDAQLLENIVRILNPYIREGIENKDLLLPPKLTLPRPKEDVFVSCEIISLFIEQVEDSFTMRWLQAENLELDYLQLKGADLWYANFRGTEFWYTNLEAARLEGVDFQGADLRHANLKGANILSARNLTAVQLLEAELDDTTLLDPDLRVEYDRLKAERGE